MTNWHDISKVREKITNFPIGYFPEKRDHEIKELLFELLNLIEGSQRDLSNHTYGEPYGR